MLHFPIYITPGLRLAGKAETQVQRKRAQKNFIVLGSFPICSLTADSGSDEVASDL